MLNKNIIIQKTLISLIIASVSLIIISIIVVFNKKNPQNSHTQQLIQDGKIMIDGVEYDIADLNQGIEIETNPVNEDENDQNKLKTIENKEETSIENKEETSIENNQ